MRRGARLAGGVVLGRRALLGALLGGAASWLSCSGGSADVAKEPAPGAADEALLGLMPAGVEGVLDVDLAGLRAWDEIEVVLGLLPGAARRALELLSPEPLYGLEAVEVGLYGLGTEQVDGLLLARGRLQRDPLLARFRAAWPAAQEVEYHRKTVLEHADRGVALLSERTAVVGPRVQVRQVIDRYFGEGESARGQRELVAALARAPRAKDGRAAALLAVVPPAPLRARLREAGWGELGAEAAYVTAALAVGDGVDLGVVAGYAALPAAQDVAQQLKGRVAQLQRRPALKLWGVDRLLGSVVVVAALAGPRRRDPEVHLAFRVPGEELHRVLQRLRRTPPPGE